MGQIQSSSPSSTITLPSRNLRSDADCLLEIFDGRLVEEQVQDNKDDNGALSDAIVLCDASPDRTVVHTLLLIPTPQRQALSSLDKNLDSNEYSPAVVVTWLLDGVSAMLAQQLSRLTTTPVTSTTTSARMYRENIEGTTVGRIELSAAVLFLIPSSLNASSQGRLAMACRLANWHRPEQAPPRSQHQQQRSIRTTLPPPQKPPIVEPARTTKTTTTTKDRSILLKQREPERNSSSSSSSMEEEKLENLTPPAMPPKTTTTTSTTPRPSSPPAATFVNKVPTLQSQIMQADGSFDQFDLNATEPRAFENDFFRGKVWVIVKPLHSHDDPFFTKHIFSTKSRRIVIQVQGQFLRKPVGTVYMGGETTTPTKMGLVTRSVFGLAVKFAQRFVPDIQFSYGDEEGLENPRFVAPLHLMMHRMVVTPPDQEVPVMTYEPFEESKELQKQRLKSKTWDWNTTDTYSFSLYSMYVDLARWKVVGVPMMADIDLRTFWNEGHFRPVIYENMSNEKRKHRQADNRYAMMLDIAYSTKPVKENIRTMADPEPNSSDDEEEGDDAEAMETSNLFTAQSLFSAQSYVEKSQSNATLSSLDDSDPITSFVVNDLEPELEPEEDEAFFDAAVADHLATPVDLSMAHFTSNGKDLLSDINMAVPAFFNSIVKHGRYTRAYAINVAGETFFVPARICDDVIEKSGYESQATKEVSETFSPRMSPQEHRRRLLGYVAMKSEFKKCPGHPDFTPRPLLQHIRPNLSEMGRDDAVLSTFVARALSDRHWEEEWAVLNTLGSMSFYYYGKRKPHFRVLISSMLSVRSMSKEESPPFYGYEFLCVETPGQTLYLMFKSAKERDAWCSTIAEKKRNFEDRKRSSDEEELEIDRPSEFMHESSIWDCKRRRIFNCGQFWFRAPKVFADPIRVVTEALELSMQAIQGNSKQARRPFLNKVAELKQIMARFLSQDERKIFFVNLYHVMLMHGFLVLGPPTGARRFVSFFGTVAYEVGDDIYSLAELEHCIIRASMAFPSQFLSRFIIPKGDFPATIDEPDFRLNFALNSGSVSLPSVVHLFSREALNEQLNVTTKLHLRATTTSQVGAGELIVTFPRVCQWFIQDFGNEQEMIKKLEPFLPTPQRAMLRPYWMPHKNRFNMSAISVRYHDFSYSCRPFVLA